MGSGLKHSLGSPALTQLSLLLLGRAGLTAWLNECFLNVICRHSHWLIVLFTTAENFLPELLLLNKQLTGNIFFWKSVPEMVIIYCKYFKQEHLPQTFLLLVGETCNVQQNILILIIEIIAENVF